jgi:O-antigen/teichoic acid export membrane protein
LRALLLWGFSKNDYCTKLDVFGALKTRTLLVKTAFAAGVKFSAAFIAFFMTVSITRLLGAEQSGLFLLAISLLAFGSVFFRLGLDNVLLRLIGADQASTRSIGSVTTGLIWSVIVAVAITLIVFLNSEFLSIHLFKKSEFTPVLSIMIWALPLMVVFTLLSFGFQAFYRVIVATLFQNLGVSSLFIIALAISYFFFENIELDAVQLSYFYLFSAIVIFFLAVFFWNRQIDGQWGEVRLKDRHLWESSSNLWVASSMSLAVQWSGILIAGAFVTSADIAYLSAAQRTAMLTSFVLMVVNMVVAPRYARLWKENNIKEMQRLAKWSTRGMIVLVLPIITLMLVVPSWIMSLFGDEFSIAGDLLAIIAIGQFVNVATGSVGYLLSMSGHERDFRRVTLFSGPLTIILSYLFILQWGVLGAAFAMAIGLSLQNLLALYMVKKRLGFWPIG